MCDLLLFLKDFFIFILIYLAGPGLSSRMWDIIFFKLRHVGSSSLTRDQTWGPCVGSVES